MQSVTIYRVKTGRDKGKWRADVSYTTRAGAVMPKSFQAKTRAEVEVKARVFLKQVAAQVPTKRTTLKEACEQFIASREDLERTKNTLRCYRQYLRSYIAPSPIADKPVAEILPHEIEELILSVPGESQPHRVKQFLSSVYKKIVIKNEILEFNRAASAELPQEKPKSKAPLTEENLRKTLAAETCPMRKAFWMFLSLTGKRPYKEAAELIWPNVEEREDGLWAYIPDAKTEAGEGWIPICKTLAAAIRALPRTSLYVFGNPETKKPYGQTYWTDAWRELQEKAGVPITTPYALRHFFASQMALKTQDAVLKRLMGHTDARTTKKYYVTVNDQALRDAVED